MIFIDMWDYVGMIHNGYILCMYMEIQSINQMYLDFRFLQDNDASSSTMDHLPGPKGSFSACYFAMF